MKRVRAIGSWLTTGVLSMATVAIVISLYPRISLETTTSTRAVTTPTTQIAHSPPVAVRQPSEGSPIREASRVVHVAPSTTTTIESTTPNATTTTSTTIAPSSSSTTTTTPVYYGGGGSDDGSGGGGGSDDGSGGGDGGGGGIDN